MLLGVIIFLAGFTTTAAQTIHPDFNAPAAVVGSVQYGLGGWLDPVQVGVDRLASKNDLFQGNRPYKIVIWEGCPQQYGTAPEEMWRLLRGNLYLAFENCSIAEVFNAFGGSESFATEKADALVDRGVVPVNLRGKWISDLTEHYSSLAAQLDTNRKEGFIGWVYRRTNGPELDTEIGAGKFNNLDELIDDINMRLKLK